MNNITRKSPSAITLCDFRSGICDILSYTIKNNKGIVLISCYFVLVVLLGLSAIAFIRSTNTARIAQRNRGSLEAFYQAEAGIAYAYAEAQANTDFLWFTHTDKNSPVSAGGESVTLGNTTINFEDPTSSEFTTMPAASIKAADLTDGTAGCYQVAGKNFVVKSYPEQADGEYTGTLVILSQATVNAVTRTIEYRIRLSSAYSFFFFFPESRDFGTATYDGRNFGAIHVNGDIVLTGNPRFYYLTTLSSGSLVEGEGYIYRPWSLFTDLQGEQAYGASPTAPRQLPGNLYQNINYRFNSGTAYFATGTYIPPEDLTADNIIVLLKYLEDANASWEFEKYTGTGLTPTVYTISNDDLKNVGIYEYAQGAGSVTLLSDMQQVAFQAPGIQGSPAQVSGTEKEVFELLLNSDFGQPSQEDNAWSEFWSDWKANHANDYLDFADAALDTDDWQRRFYRATYNWVDQDDGAPDGVNMEWWEDLSYGDDRGTEVDYMAAAQPVNYGTGEAISDRYFLNTEEQAAAWGDWLEANNLNGEENNTLVLDKSQGGAYQAPPENIITSDQTGDIVQRAKTRGIYIGPTPPDTPVYDIDACTEQASFYNALRPARDYSDETDPTPNYIASNILKIDVSCIGQAVDSNFNGIVYVDLENEWSSGDADAEGIMLINGEKLPKGGLSIVTPNNIFIKGNYNLDPTGDSDKNRDPDDAGVIQRVINNTDNDIDSAEDDLGWESAEIITTRAVYTLSEDFPDPSYMPMNWDVINQHRDGYYRVPAQQTIVELPYSQNYGEWAPTVLQTRTALPDVNNWFIYYDGGQTEPSNWQSWMMGPQTNWPSNALYELDTNEDNVVDLTVSGQNLRDQVDGYFQQRYENNYNYIAVHGSDPKNPTDTSSPSQNNTVSEKHIYNTAIITPKEIEPYVLEYWGNTERVINGALIQLPSEYDSASIPDEATYARTAAPSNVFNFESRYGRGATGSDTPGVGLTFGAFASWREIYSSNF